MVAAISSEAPVLATELRRGSYINSKWQQLNEERTAQMPLWTAVSRADTVSAPPPPRPQKMILFRSPDQIAT